MKQQCFVFGVVLCCSIAWAQPAARVSQPLLPALTALPQQLSTHSVDLVAFTDSIEAAVHNPDLDLTGILPLLTTYLQSSDVEQRRYALLTVGALADRPGSAIELKSLLPAVEAHLSEADIYLRTGAMLTFLHLQPAPQDQSIQTLVHALDTTGTTDDFGIYLSESLVHMRPADTLVQAAISGYLNRPGLPESRRANEVEVIGVPDLGDGLTQSVVDIVNHSPAGRLRDAGIVACSKIGPRAVHPIMDTIDKIQSDPAETATAHEAAQRALQTLTQP